MKNIGQMLKQAQQMQSKMAEMQEQLADTLVDGVSGAGLVKVILNCNNDLINYMTSGPIVAAVLQKDNAVEGFRKLIGSTNPEEAEEGTIRKIYAESISENAIHGSDSDENAMIESEFHFEKSEIHEY